MVPVIAFVGASGTGKTTLLEKVIRELTGRGVRVAAAKHSHHAVPMDQPGKDSWRLAQAGSAAVVLSTPAGFALFDYSGEDAPLWQAAALLEGRADLLLAEGYKWAPVPKVAVVRAAVRPELPCPPDDVIAVAGDVRLEVVAPHFGLDQIGELASFLEHYAGRSAAAPASVRR